MKILRKILWFMFGFFYHTMYCLIWGNLGSQYMRRHTLSNRTCITVNEFHEFTEGTGSPISSSSHGQSWIKISVVIYETWQWKCIHEQFSWWKYWHNSLQERPSYFLWKWWSTSKSKYQAIYLPFNLDKFLNPRLHVLNLQKMSYKEQSQ